MVTRVRFERATPSFGGWQANRNSRARSERSDRKGDPIAGHLQDVRIAFRFDGLQEFGLHRTLQIQNFNPVRISKKTARSF